MTFGGTHCVLWRGQDNYRPELNRIEILETYAKSLWHRFLSVNGADLLAENQSSMKSFGSEFTVNFG